jgi:putative sigma-54 modulation protein
MKITVRTHHISVTKSLKEHAESKIQKLEKFFNRIESINIELDANELPDENKRQVVQVTMKIPGNTIRASESSRDMYASIDMVYDKLEKQLRKHNDKLKDHKKDAQKRNIYLPTTKKAEKHTPDFYIPKPMTPEDAAEIIEETGQAFLMFRNPQTEEINVIYPTSSNTYELLEP